MSTAKGPEGRQGEQFYVTHCAVTDSVLNNPGYTVRAASATDPKLLDAAFRYPPYELPLDMWRSPPGAAAAPRRLARTVEPDGRGVWVVHSSYLVRDSVGRDRSYFSHLMLLPAADPAEVLRSWGATGWATSYAPGAPKTLDAEPELPVGTLVNDDALTAFLGDSPSGPTTLGLVTCPPRLRGPAATRRELLARVLQAFLLLQSREEQTKRLYIHAEPGTIALLLYGAVRLLPRAVAGDLTFSTFEPHQHNIRDYKLATVVGTYLGALEKGLEPELGTSRGLALDTFVSVRSSAELRKPPGESLPEGISGLIDLATRGEWETVNDIHQMVGGEWDSRGWLNGGGPRASAEPSPPDPEPPPAADPAPDAPAAKPTQTLPPIRPVGAMTYAAQITRTSPACLLFLIDQSRSMADPFVGGTGQTKACVVADALNRLIQNVVLRSAKADGVRDYFRIGVIGYGSGVKAGFGGTVPFNVLVPVSQLGAHPLRVETRTKLIPDGAGGVIEQQVKFPVWFDAEAGGQTPMCEAFAAAILAVKGFVEEFPNSYPPIILNLTDGMPTDGSPQVNARLLCNQGTRDGSALLFNLLISSKPVPPDYFPATEEHLTDNCSKLLFRMSSRLPNKLWDAAKAEGHELKPLARGVILNADPAAIVRFLDIGTRVTPSGK